MLVAGIHVCELYHLIDGYRLQTCRYDGTFLNSFSLNFITVIKQTYEIISRKGAENAENAEKSLLFLAGSASLRE